MEEQSPAGQPQHLYQSAQWSRLIRRNTLAESTTFSPSFGQSPQFPPQIDTLPSLLPQQPSAYQAQLAHYNKLIQSSGRTSRLQSSPLSPVVSAHHVQAAPRSVSTGSDNTIRPRNTRSGHGNKKTPVIGNGERPLITKEDTPIKMSTKKFDLAKQHHSRPLAKHQDSMTSQRSESVPTTPHQHARQFSLGSRDPSPNAAPNHSPRSAYSESNSTMPSLRPMAHRFGACKYETAMAHSRRRMAYSIGSDKLEKVKASSIKSTLSAEEERKLTEDMRELYNRLLPTPESEARRQKFVQKLEKLLNDEWPGHDIRVHMFGSSGNLLCTDESDVDICITTEWKELEGVCMLAECLAKHGMEKVICVSTAKVPIVKIWDPELGLACDMNVNNTLALENTRMIKTYVEIDDRVRPLAMIIKHWTKRRVVNDAAFGGTLSSYTWICMIINFLQTRDPFILPSLHQRPHQKLPSQNGHESAFADNIDALRNSSGKDNKETLGELLFQFFKFFGHEMDYDRQVLSVRSGKLISKVEKGWHLATNNRLCVEEPFNTSRNLGNTADDTSFRGLHMEIRRAFDLVSVAKLAECCEEYVFPKEEERIWEKPPPQPRPVLSRTPSQQSRGGKNNYRGGRHNNHTRNGNNNRRASSGAFDGNSNYLPQQHPQGLTPSEVWTHTQAAQERLHNDLYTTFSVLQAQENNLRLQLYNQSQAYAQAQAQAFHQARRLQPNGSISKQQATDRSRGSSFDNPPLTAPIRPDAYYYPLQYQPMPVYGSHSPSTYPSSPALSPAVPEQRRSLHRSTVTGGSGAPSGTASGSMRSHSQPAARTVPSPLALQGLAASNYGLGGFSNYQLPQHINSRIPSFYADDNMDSGFETESAPGLGESPPDGTPKEYVGYYLNGTPSSNPRKESVVPPPIPAFGDIPSRRRPSTDQFPQAIFDRLRRTSRSPSPLGRNRGYSASGTLNIAGPHQSVSSSNLRALNDQGPLVVNGSTSISSFQSSDRHVSLGDKSLPEEPQYDPLAASVESLYLDTTYDVDVDHSRESVTHSFTHNPETGIWKESAPMVNGTGANTFDATPDRHAAVNGLGITADLSKVHSLPESSNALNRLSPSRIAAGRQPSNGAISPLDIGFTKAENLRDDIPHLSPVYETRTPSPTASRKFEPGFDNHRNESSNVPQSSNHDSKPALKLALANSTYKATVPSKPNGHIRAAKSEGGSATGAWQKIPKGKKRGQVLEQKPAITGAQPFAEQKPVMESERKGG